MSAQRPGAGTVADIMSSPVITAAAEETVADAASQMVDAKMGVGGGAGPATGGASTSRCYVSPEELQAVVDGDGHSQP